MTDPVDPATAVPPGEGDSPPGDPAPGPSAAPARPLPEPRQRHYRLSRQVRNRPKVLAARRANLVKARAAARASIYRPTERRRAASRANIQKAHAWRRSAKGNEIARRNAYRHGLSVKKLPELLVPLGEGPEDLERHREMVWEALRPRDAVEEDWVERLAQAAWRRLRLFRGCARQEILMWRRLQARGVPEQGLSQEETERRAAVITWRIQQSDSLQDEASRLGTRILKLLESFLAVRSVEEEPAD